MPFWHQDQPNIEDAAEYGDVFGTTLTAGDFDHDGHDDLVIGVSSESVGTIAYAGAVNVLYGSPSGVRNDRVQFWHQDVSDVEDISVERDYFGAALVAGDFNGDGSDDLAIGIPGDELIPFHYNIIDPGAVGVIYGSGGLGLSAVYPADQRWTQAY